MHGQYNTTAKYTTQTEMEEGEEGEARRRVAVFLHSEAEQAGDGARPPPGFLIDRSVSGRPRLRNTHCTNAENVPRTHTAVSSVQS